MMLENLKKKEHGGYKSKRLFKRQHTSKGQLLQPIQGRNCRF